MRVQYIAMKVLYWRQWIPIHTCRRSEVRKAGVQWEMQEGSTPPVEAICLMACSWDLEQENKIHMCIHVYMHYTNPEEVVHNQHS